MQPTYWLYTSLYLVCDVCEMWLFFHIECDCNGYNPTCDRGNGSCTCLDIGVSGDRCTTCDTLALYDGDAENFCHCK